MRQRLGIAHALLGDPQVLILDEPANGLDPEGIFWMRGLLRDFADRGGTVLLSSHLLREVEAVADRLVVIGNGRIVADGAKEELLAGVGHPCPRDWTRDALGAALAESAWSASRTRPTARCSSSRAPRPSAGVAAAEALVLTELHRRRRRRPGGAVPHPDLEQPPVTAVGGMSADRDDPRACTALAARAPRSPRLTYVELRKMTDTRAGFWLLVIIVASTLAAAILRMALGDESERTLQDAFSVAQLPCSVLLPILGILCVTSEWSQRTALTTFALVTKRSRVVLAKVLAAVVISARRVVLALLFAVLGTIIGSIVFGTGAWTLSLTAIGESFLLQLIGTMGGIAFGMVFLASAPAIVLYFVLPTIWGILTAIIPGMDDVAKWLDLGPSTTDLSEFDISGIGWARLATSVALWVAVPFAIGLVRIIRREVS